MSYSGKSPQEKRGGSQRIDNPERGSVKTLGQGPSESRAEEGHFAAPRQGAEAL
jgi:hypothetical protein